MKKNTIAHRPATSDHVHDALPLDTAFDFLNTLELENGALVERLSTLDTAVTWLVDAGDAQLLASAMTILGSDDGFGIVRSGSAGSTA